MDANSKKVKNDINVIILRNRVYNSKQEIIEVYIDLLKICKSAKDFYEVLGDLYDETLVLAAEKFVEMQISKNAEILEEVKVYSSR